MDIKKEEIKFVEFSKQDYKQAFMDDHTTCCLCGTDLYMTHVTNFVEHQVTEEAFCEHCRVRTRKSEHSLQ